MVANRRRDTGLRTQEDAKRFLQEEAAAFKARQTLDSTQRDPVEQNKWDLDALERKAAEAKQRLRSA